MTSIQSFSSRLAGLAVVLAFAGVFLLSPVNAHAALAGVTLTATALPSSALAGSGSSTLTAGNFPTGETAGTLTVTFYSGSCGGTLVTSEAPTLLSKYAGTVYHVVFPIPSVATGTYYISLSGTSPSFTSTNCSTIQITATTTTLAACVPTSSLAVVAGTNVNAFVPNGSWCCSGGTGIQEVPLEGTGVRASFATAGDVNSCAANSSTGEVVCVDNGTGVYTINGSTINSYTSGANAYAGFSGGECENCGVGVNAGNNTAVIEEGISGSPSGSGVQVFNLATNTFNAPFPLNYIVSEDISIDSGRNLILSPGEGGVYDLLKIGTGNSLTEYSQSIPYSGGEPDSAAEDCTTGIALSSLEFTSEIYITDLTQATFGAGTWSSPGQLFDLSPGGDGYSAGTCGISSAPGSGHLAVVTGEFGGSAFAALQLPSTSGTGTPTLVDYAYVGSLPGFSAGYDPHTVTAYTSPNNNKSYAVFAGYSGYSPSTLAVVDLACVLAAPRSSLHTVTLPLSASCYSFISVH